MKNKKVLFTLLLIGLAASSRLLPHPPNFTAIGAMAIFGGAVFSSSKMKYLLTFGALIISDLVLNNTIYSSGSFSFYYSGMIWVYGSFGLLIFLGSRISQVSTKSVIGSSVLGAFLFFLLTNFGYWYSGILYPKTFAGLITCYEAAIPFFGNTLVSTILFSSILFGSLFFAEKKVLAPARV